MYFRVDAFAVSSDTNLGHITKIRVGHDNKGFAAAWYLSKVSKTLGKLHPEHIWLYPLRKLYHEHIRLYPLGKLYHEHIRLFPLEKIYHEHIQLYPLEKIRYEHTRLYPLGKLYLEHYFINTFLLYLQVTLEDRKAGEVYEFPCHRWIPDKKTKSLFVELSKMFSLLAILFLNVRNNVLVVELTSKKQPRCEDIQTVPVPVSEC